MVSLPELKPQLALIRNIFQQLYNYVRWHGLAKPVRTRSPRSLLSRYVRKVSNAKGKGMATRKRTILEIYSELYYDSKLRSIVKEELDSDLSYSSLTQNERSARQMTAYPRYALKLMLASLMMLRLKYRKFMIKSIMTKMTLLTRKKKKKKTMTTITTTMIMAVQMRRIYFNDKKS